MLSQHIRTAMRQAKYEILSYGKSFYGGIPGFQGVYADAKILEDCCDELEKILEG
jgi:hypothetical protein